MHYACFAVLLSAVVISAEMDSQIVLNPRFRPTLNLDPVRPHVKIQPRENLKESQEFKDIVNYLEYNVSPRDIQEMLDVLPEALERLNEELSAEEDSEIMPRNIVGDMFNKIPWHKITDTLKNMAKSNGKFTKVLDLVNDPKFRELLKKAVNSHTLSEFLKGVATHGFSWTEFLHLLLHALCSAATTIQHDQYSVGVCKILQNL